VTWFVLILRLFSRRLHRGAWKRLQLDDYLIVLAMVRLHCTKVPAYTDRSQLTDTILMVYMSKIVVTSSNLIPPGEDVSQYSEAGGRADADRDYLASESVFAHNVLPHDYRTTATQTGCRDLYLRRRLFRRYGDTLSWRVVSPIQPVLGRAYTLK
jgi:hypothetical protein